MAKWRKPSCVLFIFLLFPSLSGWEYLSIVSSLPIHSTILTKDTRAHSKTIYFISTNKKNEHHDYSCERPSVQYESRKTSSFVWPDGTSFECDGRRPEDTKSSDVLHEIHKYDQDTSHSTPLWSGLWKASSAHYGGQSLVRGVKEDSSSPFNKSKCIKRIWTDCIASNKMSGRHKWPERKFCDDQSNSMP